MEHYRKNGFLNGAPRFFIFILLLGCCTFIFPASATAAEKPKVDKTNTAPPAQTSAPPAVPQPAQPSAPTVNSITQAAVKGGVLSCASRINQIMTYITANSQSGAYLFFPKSQPDQSIFSASVEVQSQNATPIYASASFAPLTNGTAGAGFGDDKWTTSAGIGVSF